MYCVVPYRTGTARPADSACKHGKHVRWWWYECGERMAAHAFCNAWQSIDYGFFLFSAQLSLEAGSLEDTVRPSAAVAAECAILCIQYSKYFHDEVWLAQSCSLQNLQRHTQCHSPSIRSRYVQYGAVQYCMSEAGHDYL